MSHLAIETRNLDRTYKIRGNKKEEKVLKDLEALSEVNVQIDRMTNY